MPKIRIRAFTVMELMTVVIIVGAIAVFAIPNLTRSMDDSYRRDAITQLTVIHAANKLYRTQNNNAYWPPNSASGDTLAEINAALGLSIIANGVNYSCAPNGPVGQTYVCFATRGAFTAAVTQAPLSSSNPSYPCGLSSC